MSKKKDRIASYTIIFGILLFVFSIGYYLYNNSLLIEDGEITSGKIIGYKDLDSDDNFKNPVVEFMVGDKKIQFVNSDYILTYVKNNKVYVMYSKSNYKEAMIYEGYLVWGVPLSIAIIGILTSIFGYIIFVFRNK